MRSESWFVILQCLMGFRQGVQSGRAPRRDHLSKVSLYSASCSIIYTGMDPESSSPEPVEVHLQGTSNAKRGCLAHHVWMTEHCSTTQRQMELICSEREEDGRRFDYSVSSRRPASQRERARRFRRPIIRAKRGVSVRGHETLPQTTKGPRFPFPFRLESSSSSSSSSRSSSSSIFHLHL
jgi:hypothetical protein